MKNIPSLQPGDRPQHGKHSIVLNVPFRFCSAVLFLALGALLPAAAQSNGVPGPADYTSFTRYITQHNIFDPSRYGVVPDRPRFELRHQDPMFTFVGTISYPKGRFAFFNGNDSALRQVLQLSGTIAGYTVKEITLSQVTLESPDHKEKVFLKIGAGMRQQNGVWVLAAPGEMAESSAETASSAPGDSSAETSAAPPSAGEQNDVLKKLMQQREQMEK